jgi:hypothetical protein
MKRRFVIGVEGLSKDADTKFRKFLSDLGAGYWHWIENLWLVTVDNDEISTERISKQLNELGSERNLVLEIPEDLDWAAWGRPNVKGRTMFEWLKTTWVGKSG